MSDYKEGIDTDGRVSEGIGDGIVSIDFKNGMITVKPIPTRK